MAAGGYSDVFSAAVSRPYFPLGHPVSTLECIEGKGVYGGEEAGGGPFYADRVRPDGILTLQGKVLFQGKKYELKVRVCRVAKSSLDGKCMEILSAHKKGRTIFF